MLIILKTREAGSPTLCRNAELQIFDLLQLSKKERECREIFVTLKQQLQRTCDKDKNCIPINEMILRRKVENAVHCYRFFRRERIRLFRNYMDRLPAHNNVAA